MINTTSLHIGKLMSYAISMRTTTDFLQVRSNSEYLLQGSKSINDRPFLNCLENIFNKNLYSAAADSVHLKSFSNNFASWVNSASSKVTGLDNYDPDFSAGTTQAFDSFYFRHRTKRFRCLVGEYFYHLKVWQSSDVEWEFIDDDHPLKEGDALVLSLPFCDTGSILNQYEDLMVICTEKNIPVLVDCCYYVLAGGITINVEHSCIDTVVFSLSKAFHVANMRIGVRYTRKDIFDGQKLHHSINYNNSLSAYIGQEIINKFSPDYFFNTYRAKQLEFCAIAKLNPSDSILFALGDSSWDNYSRRNLLRVYQLRFNPNMFTNRILLQPIYDNWDIFKAITNEI